MNRNEPETNDNAWLTAHRHNVYSGKVLLYKIVNRTTKQLINSRRFVNAINDSYTRDFLQGNYHYSLEKTSTNFLLISSPQNNTLWSREYMK